jgi:hypothetical protein
LGDDSYRHIDRDHHLSFPTPPFLLLRMRTARGLILEEGSCHTFHLEAPSNAALNRRCSIAHLEVKIHSCPCGTASKHRLGNPQLDQRLVNIVRLRRAVFTLATGHGTARILYAHTRLAHLLSFTSLHGHVRWVNRCQAHLCGQGSCPRSGLARSPRTRCHSTAARR